ncbi:hypothetical protein HDU97_000830 [Phlyctochytrium planicorne]|nr:hypothetical protein HDU97_000830 [Phlyctochytrium planicorne]
MKLIEISEDSHGICKTTASSIPPSRPNSLKSAAQREYTTLAELQDDLDAIFTGAASAFDLKSFEYQEVDRIWKFATTLLNAQLEKEASQEAVSSKRKEKRGAQVSQDVAISKRQKVAYFKQEFDGSFAFSSAVPSYVNEDLASDSVEIKNIFLTVSQPNKRDPGKVNNTQDGHGTEISVDEIYESFVPLALPLSPALSAAESSYISRHLDKPNAKKHVPSLEVPDAEELQKSLPPIYSLLIADTVGDRSLLGSEVEKTLSGLAEVHGLLDGQLPQQFMTVEPIFRGLVK